MRDALLFDPADAAVQIFKVKTFSVFEVKVPLARSLASILATRYAKRTRNHFTDVPFEERSEDTLIIN